MIEDVTSQVKRMNPAQIQDLEQIVQTPQKELGFWKKAGIGALGVLGLYTAGQAVMPPTNAYAQDAVVTLQEPNGKPFSATIIGNHAYVDGKEIGVVQGNNVRPIPGVEYQGKANLGPNGAFISGVTPLTPQGSYDNTPTYKSEIDRLNAAIKQNPNSLQPYVALVDFYINKGYDKKDTNIAIKTYERALPRAEYMTNEDNAKVRDILGRAFYSRNEIGKSIKMFKEELKYDSSNAKVKEYIERLEKYKH